MLSGINTELIYIHDPMCSWCWGFERVKFELLKMLPEKIGYRLLLGGLAADTEQLMPPHMQAQIQQNWRCIEETIPGIKFNFDFWSIADPRRSTYPACRAVIAARQQGNRYDEKMTERIQQAYYKEAMNPSDNIVLVKLAAELGLDQERFHQALTEDATQRVLLDEIQLCRKLHIDSFPGLVLRVNDSTWPIAIDYLDASSMLELILMLMNENDE